MKIAIFTARLVYGGGEKVQNWVAHKLVDSGIEVAYFAPKVDEDYIKKLNQIQLKDKVSVVEFPHHIKKRHPLQFVSSMKKLYRENNIDAILIFGGSLLEQLAARRCGVKVILAERCNPGWRSLPSRILKQLQYRIADGYIFQTQEQSECYSNYAQSHCAIILNPIIDQPLLKEVPLRKEIVTVGRLSAEKNIKGLINAFALFHLKHSDYHLIIYGSGSQREELNNLIDDCKITESVEIIEGKTNITELIQGASLFVFNSTNEGMPNALVEAMSVGLACISADCPIYGPRALINNGENGILVPVYDDQALYNKMCEVIENPDLANKLRKNAIAIRETLKPSKIANQWVEQITKIIST